MSVVNVDFRTRRHKANGKMLIRRTVECIESLGHEIAGFAIVAWDDAGASSFSYQEGGPIAEGAIPTHISNKLNASIAKPVVHP